VKKQPALQLGPWRPLDGSEGGPVLRLPPEHLVTHSVIVGMTGSGKSGLVTVLAEEAMGAGIPILMVDVKGDLPNLLLAFADFAPEAYLPWLDAEQEGGSDAVSARAAQLAKERHAALAEHAIGEAELKRFASKTRVRVLTPGASSGEPLHVLSPLERRSARWESDPESARAALSAAVSLVLRLLGRDPDPAKSKEHVLLSVLAERRFSAGLDADLKALMQDVLEPPIEEVGAMPINAFMRKAERTQLAAGLNTLLASPSFASWRQGASLDVGEWLKPKDGRTPAVIVSVAHLDDEERGLVMGLLLEEVLSWVRGLSGTQRLRALILFDEVYGFLPPHPANPPTKRPLVALMKQARGFGVGVVVATQNPMDLDYRALSNAGLWFLGRLQTDADRARVLDGLLGSEGTQDLSAAELARTIQRLAQRWFIVRNAHVPAAPILLQPRYAMSWLRGPMTRHELRRARDANWAEEPPPASTPKPIVQTPGTSETKPTAGATATIAKAPHRRVEA